MSPAESSIIPLSDSERLAFLASIDRQLAEIERRRPQTRRVDDGRAG